LLPVNRIRITPAHTSPIAYDVVIDAGVLDSLPALLQEAARSPHYVLICDSNVAPHWAGAVRTAVNATGARMDLLVFDAGEASKTRDTWAQLSDAMLERGAGRDACVLALGGGVCCDLAGFVAATYMRGIPCVHIPSSLLAMIDASIGGKTAVDVPHGKNLIGAFLDPRIVVVDPRLLHTLPEAELRAGLAEAVKHGAIADGEYLDWIGANADRIIARDNTVLEHLVRRSVEIKAAVVMADPRESGPRASLNFGHTIAHALEKVLGFAMSHGHAVAIGMVMEAALGEAIGVTSPGTMQRIRDALRTIGLPSDLPDGVDPVEVVDATATDKKARGARVRYTLLQTTGGVARTHGGAWTHEIAPTPVLQILRQVTA
jgi:3-dehydroquinate synthase